MNPQRLDRRQAAALYRALGPRLRWFGRLCDRMDRLGVDPSDPIRTAAYEAFDAIHALSVHAHYRSCESGVGEPPAVPR